MGTETKIQWTDHTFNPWIGCQKVSPGCKHCYAEHNAFVRIQRSEDRELWGPKGERHVTSDANWRKPLAWNAAAEAAGKRARVFCASLADVFEDRPELEAPRRRLWDLIEATPWLDWQLLTKRPENAIAMKPPRWRYYPRNVWIGTSAEDQERWDERIPHLVRMPAFTVFVSAEPLLGPIDCGDALDCIEWVIVGGESGPDARPFDVAWARSLVKQCQEHGSAPFVKQLGSKPVHECERCKGKHPGRCRMSGGDDGHDHDRVLPIYFRDRKGGDIEEWPKDLRIREMPASPAEVRA